VEVCAANFLADLVNLTLVLNFGLILGAFVGQIARDLKEGRFRKREVRATVLAG
jgi:hypothetical protein